MSRITNFHRKIICRCIIRKNVIYMNDVIYIEILTSNGTASQSSDWYWKDKNKTMTADLAVTGGRTNTILSLSCSVTQPKPKRYVAWWMLMFPVDTVYITNVLIYYRGNSKFFIRGNSSIYLSFLVSLTVSYIVHTYLVTRYKCNNEIREICYLNVNCTFILVYTRRIHWRVLWLKC
jgi:hypothetical protein